MFRISNMRTILSFIFLALWSFSLYGQDTVISPQDSVLLRNFWGDFTKAIKNKDKTKLTELCKFPFYCRPCLDYLPAKDTIPETILVTSESYQKELFKLFFEDPLRGEIGRKEKFNLGLFREAFDDRREKNGFWFGYFIVPPYDNREGIQGIIYLKKKHNRYKIVGIDVVP